MRAPLQIPIAIKLSAVTVLLLLGAMVPLTWKTTDTFKTRSEKREKAANRAEADAHAQEARTILRGFIKKTRATASASLKSASEKGPSHLLDEMRLRFTKDEAVLSLAIVERDRASERIVSRSVDEEALTAWHLPSDYLDRLSAHSPVSIAQAFAGTTVVEARAVATFPPVLTLAVPLARDARGKVVRVAVLNAAANVLQRSIERHSARATYLVDGKGALVAHSDEKLLRSGDDFAQLGIVRKALASKAGRGHATYVKAGADERFLGSFVKLGHGLIAISEASEEVIQEPLRLVRRQVVAVTVVVLALSLFIVFAFAHSLTRPIQKLARLTKLVSVGNFSVLATQTVNSNDEVGTLAASFDAMVEGLKERDKVRTLFNKFHGSGVAESLLQAKGPGSSGASRKVAVCFSDIRGFTAISERNPPERVVAMLNEYFTRMVGVIHGSAGVVDKFMGDAIMAVWGAPQSTGRDALNAVKACLAMRAELAKLNESRIARGESPLLIGMGLHLGEAISGTIGSEERMEYTVIGDAVNIAARIETATKAFGADLLVSESLLAELRDELIAEPVGTIASKGHSEPLKLFKVSGYVDAKGRRVIVKTPYSEYPPQIPSDFAVQFPSPPPVPA